MDKFKEMVRILRLWKAFLVIGIPTGTGIVFYNFAFAQFSLICNSPSILSGTCFMYNPADFAKLMAIVGASITIMIEFSLTHFRWPIIQKAQIGIADKD